MDEGKRRIEHVQHGVARCLHSADVRGLINRGSDPRGRRVGSAVPGAAQVDGTVPQAVSITVLVTAVSPVGAVNVSSVTSVLRMSDVSSTKYRTSARAVPMETSTKSAARRNRFIFMPL